MNSHATHFIVNARSLGAAAAILHDARIPDGGFAFDPPSRAFELVAWQYSPFSYTGPSCVWIGWELTFRDVIRFRQRQAEPSVTQGYHELSTMRFYGHRQMVVIMTHFDLTLYLRVASLNGRLRETGDYRCDLNTP